jgi:hypothetical protein
VTEIGFFFFFFFVFVFFFSRQWIPIPHSIAHIPSILAILIFSSTFFSPTRSLKNSERSASVSALLKPILASLRSSPRPLREGAAQCLARAIHGAADVLDDRALSLLVRRVCTALTDATLGGCRADV